MKDKFASKVEKLALLKIQIDAVPFASLLAIPLTNEFISEYKALERLAPKFSREKIDGLIFTEIERLKT